MHAVLMNRFIGGAWASVSLLFFFDRSGGLSMAVSCLSFKSYWACLCRPHVVR